MENQVALGGYYQGPRWVRDQALLGLAALVVGLVIKGLWELLRCITGLF